MLGYTNIPPVCLGLHTPLEYPEPKSLKIKFRDFLYTGFVYKYLIQGIKAFKVSNGDDLEIVKKNFSPDFLVRKVRHPINYGKRKIFLNEDNQIRLVFIGRLAEEKGINILIKILDLLKEKEVPYSIKIAGTGHQDYINRLKNMQESNLSGYNLEYLGQLGSKELDELYKWTDLVLVPSYFETLSQVAIETCLNGKIAVCSDVSGPREILANCGEDFLIPLDSSKFAEKIIELRNIKKNNHSSLKEIGLRLQEEVAARFSSESNLKELEKLLIEVSKVSN
jgi:glycosyltransferase involved in cell wall biosynthesis